MWMERGGHGVGGSGGAVPFVSITFISRVIFDAQKKKKKKKLRRVVSKLSAATSLSERIDVAVAVFSRDEGSSQAENSADSH